MGSDPPPYGYEDEETGEWIYGPRPPKKERHKCSFQIRWKPKGKTKFVSWEFEEEYTWISTAALAWLLEDHKSFSEECTPSNVTEDDASKASVLVGAIIEALLEGDRSVLDHFDAFLARLDSDGIHRGNGTRDRRRAQFVDELKNHSIEIQAAPEQQKDKLVSDLIQRVSAYSKTFATLDAAMVKHDVLSIDPHSKGGRQKGGGGKKGPPWLGARLIVMANAHDDFELYRHRPNQTEDNHFDYVVDKLQQASRPGRGKPKSLATKTKSKPKKP